MRQVSRSPGVLATAAVLVVTSAILATWIANSLGRDGIPVSPAAADLATSWLEPPATPMRYSIRCIPLPDGGSTSGSQATGDTFFVSTTGSNSNPGTIDQPWQTIQFAVDHARAGDTICVRAGTYLESVNISGAGTQDSPLALSAYNSESVIVDGGDFPAIRSDGHDEDYWEINELTLESRGRYAMQVSSWDCINAADCHGSNHWGMHNLVIRGAVFLNGSHNLFESNEVDGSRHTGDENGVLEAGINSHHNVYRNNEVHDFTDRGFWSESYTHNSLWEGNYVHDIWGDDFSQSIDMDGYTTVEWGHTIRGNRIEGGSGLAVQLENTFASVVENNVIVAPRRQGIVVINYEDCQVDSEKRQYGGENCVGAITSNIVRQNLIYNGGDWGGIISYQAGGIQILGNTLVQIKGPCIDLRGQGTTPQIALRGNILACSTAVSMDALSSFIADEHNLLDPQGGAYDVRGGEQYSLAQYREVTGHGTGSVQADPLFIDPATGDFHLQLGSPAVDAGIDLGVAADPDGTPRPQGKGWDIGAFELIP